MKIVKKTEILDIEDVIKRLKNGQGILLWIDENHKSVVILKDASYGQNYGWASLFYHRGKDSHNIGNIEDFIKKHVDECYYFENEIAALDFMRNYYIGLQMADES